MNGISHYFLSALYKDNNFLPILMVFTLDCGIFFRMKQLKSTPEALCFDLYKNTRGLEELQKSSKEFYAW